MKYRQSKQFAATLLLLVFLTPVCSVAIAQPRLQVDPAAFKMDTAAPGIVFRRVNIKNTGDQNLRIAEIRTSCGCTTVPLTKHTLVPQDTSILNVRMDLHEKEGAMAKEIYIVSNDPVDTLREVRLQTFLTRDLVVNPTSFPSKLNLPVGHEAMTTVMLTNTGRDSLTILSAVMNAEGLSARFSNASNKTLGPGSSCPLDMYVTPTRSGALRGTVDIATNSRLAPNVKVDFVCIATTPQQASVPTR